MSASNPFQHTVGERGLETYSTENILSKCLVDVLWGQPIKLIQVFSTSEFHEYCALCAGPQKPQTLTGSKIEYENF